MSAQSASAPVGFAAGPIVLIDPLAASSPRRMSLEQASEENGGRLVIAFKRGGSAPAEQIRKLIEAEPDAVIIVLACKSDINSGQAVELMRIGAFDIIIQPVDARTLNARLTQADAELARRLAERRERECAAALLDRLSPRETDVMIELVAGASNKVAARKLGLSPRTVEFHRARIFERLKIASVVELARIALTADRAFVARTRLPASA